MRTMIRAGTLEEGDSYGRYVVTGLGRTWIAADEENCALGAEPGEQVRVQYAYLADPGGERIEEIERKLDLLKNSPSYCSYSKREQRERQDKIDRLESELGELMEGE